MGYWGGNDRGQVLQDGNRYAVDACGRGIVEAHDDRQHLLLRRSPKTEAVRLRLLDLLSLLLLLGTSPLTAEVFIYPPADLVDLVDVEFVDTVGQVGIPPHFDSVSIHQLRWQGAPGGPA